MRYCWWNYQELMRNNIQVPTPTAHTVYKGQKGLLRQECPQSKARREHSFQITKGKQINHKPRTSSAAKPSFYHQGYEKTTFIPKERQGELGPYDPFLHNPLEVDWGEGEAVMQNGVNIQFVSLMLYDSGTRSQDCKEFINVICPDERYSSKSELEDRRNSELCSLRLQEGLTLSECLSLKISTIICIFKGLYWFDVFSLHGCLCIMYVPGAHRGTKRALRPLELALQVTMSCHVCAVKRTWVLWKNNKHF